MPRKNLIVSAIIAVFFLIVFILLVNGLQEPMEEPSPVDESTEPEIAPEAALPLPTGKQTYEIMTDSTRKFKIAEVEFNPLDVKKGESQQVRVLVKDFEYKPITQENKVEGTVYTDNKTTPFFFKLKEISDATGTNMTYWEGSWILEDTYNRIYIISIVARATDREHTIDITFR